MKIASVKELINSLRIEYGGVERYQDV